MVVVKNIHDILHSLTIALIVNAVVLYPPQLKIKRGSNFSLTVHT